MRFVSQLLLLPLLIGLLPAAEAQEPPAPPAAPVEAPADAEISFRATPGSLLAEESRLHRLSGLVDVRLEIRWSDEGPTRSLELSCEDLRYGDLRLGEVRATVASRAGSDVSVVELSATGPHGGLKANIEADIGYDPSTRTVIWRPGPVKAELSVEELDLGLLGRFVAWLPVSGRGTLHATLGGRSDEPRIEARLESRTATWRGHSLGDTALSWTHDGRRSEASLRWGPTEAPMARARLEAELDVDLLGPSVHWKDSGPHELSVETSALSQDKLRIFRPLPHGVKAEISVSAQSRGSLERLAASLEIGGWYSTRGGERQDLSLELQLGPRAQTASFMLGEGLLLAELEVGADLVAARRRGRGLGEATLRGTAVSALPLGLLAPWLPAALYDPRGTLRGNAAVSGTLSAPSADGEIWLADGELTVTSLNRRLRSIHVASSLKGREWSITEISADGRPGAVAGSGTIRLLPAAQGEGGRAPWRLWRLEGSSKLSAAGFPVIQPGIPVGAFSGDAAVSWEAGGGDSRVSVEISGFELQLSDEEMPEAGAVPTNRAIHSKAELQPGTEEEREHGGSMSLEVALSDPGRVVGPRASLDLRGRMKVRRTGDVVRVDGGLDVVPGGRMQLFDNEAVIRAGRFGLGEGWLGRPAESSFEQVAWAPAPLEPALDLVARVEASDTSVLARLHGAAKRPALVLVSKPSLPEYQIMTLLILGRVDTSEDRDGNVRRRVAEMVERYHNPSLERQLNDKLGVDRLGLGFGSSVKNPIVTVGRQVTRDLYVETVYHHDAPPDANEREGHVEYRVGSAWTLDTVFGDAAEGGFGVFWGTSFGGPPPPPPPDENWGVSEHGHRPDTDEDGVEDPFDRCQRVAEDKDGFEDEDGCPETDNDGDGVADAQDKAPDEAETVNGFEDEDGAPDTAPQKLGSLRARVMTLPFRAGASRLSREQRASLGAVADVLALFPELRLEVTGHSDDVGARRQKLQVSRARARSVVAILRRAGVPGERLSAKGAGDSQPADPARTREARAKNRRASLELLLP